MLDRLKVLYSTYNLFNKSKLAHNLKLYKELGLKKSYFSPISSKDFENIDASALLKPYKGTVLTTTCLFQKLSKHNQQNLVNFDKNGFAILKNYLSIETVNQINREVEDLAKQSKVKSLNNGKVMFAFKKSKTLREVGESDQLIELLSSLMEEEVKLFQSINFTMGSQQFTHSDSIHMTTFPLGGLMGAWIALEDIDLDNGPLHYYPGSHKLPYFLNKDYNNEGSSLLLGNKDYPEYEKMIAQKIEEYNLTKMVFTAKAGDMIIWHANLLHGGEIHINKQKTRKSVVFHYYGKNRICYHEITQRPALIGE